MKLGGVSVMFSCSIQSHVVLVFKCCSAGTLWFAVFVYSRETTETLEQGVILCLHERDSLAS